MRNQKRIVNLALVLTLTLALLWGCGKTTAPSSTAHNTATTVKTSTSTPTPAPTVMNPPQKVFIDGAKALISTDMMNLLTGTENGSTLLGMPSSFLSDLNGSSNETGFSATFSDLVDNGETKKEGANFSLNTAHDAASGDSSLVVSLGAGKDTESTAGITINGATALLKSASTTKKVILYSMPDSGGNNFLDKSTCLLTGLLSNTGKASTISGNLKDRTNLAAKYLDQWMSDTKPDEYTDSQLTKSLCGKDVSCRVITLSMTGQRAYSFLLGKMQALQADAQFAEMDESLGDIMGLLSTGIQDTSGKNAASAAPGSSTKQLIAELKALTPAEITAAKFIVSVVFNGEKAIGIDVEASTTAKVSKLSLLLYRNGPEHQISLYYQSIDGTSATVESSKISTGSNAYAVAAQLNTADSKGLEASAGSFKGTVTESESKYAINGTYSLSLTVPDDKGKKQKATFGGDLNFNLTHTKGIGYAGSGTASLSVSVPKNTTSMKAALSLNLTLKNSVTVTPPLYIKSKAVTFTTKQELFKAMGLDWKDVSGQSVPVQAVLLAIGMLVS